jgi:hypothetical protein
MNIRVTFAGETDLQHVCYVGEVHSSGCDIGREEDTGFRVSEGVCGFGAGTLS